MAHLEVISSKGLLRDMSGKKISISGDIRIGRHPDSDVWVNNRNVSREHCRILERDDTCFIEDCSSRNGTLLNGKKIEIKQLSNGDIIAIPSGEVIVLKYCETVRQELADTLDTLRTCGDQSV